MVLIPAAQIIVGALIIQAQYKPGYDSPMRAVLCCEEGESFMIIFFVKRENPHA
jgi:hypothetical protein